MELLEELEKKEITIEVDFSTLELTTNLYKLLLLISENPSLPPPSLSPTRSQHS